MTGGQVAIQSSTRHTKLRRRTRQILDYRDFQSLATSATSKNGLRVTKFCSRRLGNARVGYGITSLSSGSRQTLDFSCKMASLGAACASLVHPTSRLLFPKEFVHFLS